MDGELEFNVESAVNEIGEGLGFGGEESTSDNDDVNLEVSKPKEAAKPAIPAAEKPAPAAVDPAKPVDPAAPATPAAPTEKVAPRTWRPEASSHWATLPPQVQDEILKREDDMFRGLEGYKQDAGLGKSVQQIIAPHLSLMQAQKVNPLDVIDNYMKMQTLMLTGTQAQKQAVIQNVIKAYNVDYNPPPAGEAPYVDPQVQSLQSELNSVKSRQQEIEAARQEEIRVSIKKDLDTFAADPAHPYFLEVADDIVLLLKGGAANLAEAYEKAVWANPITRAKEQARATTEAVAKKQKEDAERAEAVKKSTAVNVKATVRNGSGTAPLGSIDDTLAETFRAIKARGG